MSLNSGHKVIEKLTDTLKSKIGDGIGVITKGGTITSGSVARVEDKILTLANTSTYVQGRGRFAAVAFIPLFEIATILDDLDPTEFNVQQ
ncbi:hypothetical protein COI61_27940 [Bacillus cereus]|nr:hypothetical protein COI61_27940 [Bacillus cereus]